MIKKYLKTLLTTALFIALSCPLSIEQGLITEARAATGDFTLTWSSNSSYTPPGYVGLALPTMGGKIKVFALPTKKLALDPEKLTYRWRLDEVVVGWAGGQGKSVFSFDVKKWPGDHYNVESQILDGENIVWRGFAEIKISSAEVVFQTLNSDYSATEKIDTKTGQTVKITAIPFFFNTKDPNSLNFRWKLDEEELINTDGKDFNIFSLTIPTAQLKNAITKKIKLLISDKNNSDYQASSQITVTIK